MYKDCLRLLAALVVVAVTGTNLLAADGPASDVDLRLPPPDLFDIGWPTWTPHGVPLDTPWTLFNWGDTDLAITLTPVQDNGPTGWLTISSELQGTVVIPSGENNSVTGTITLNTGGVVNAPGTIVYLRGRIDLDPDGYAYGPDPLEVECWVADTVYLPAYDTITTGCLALVVGNSGNCGSQGMGRVNMDFFDHGDCDTVDSIPGESDVYLYDGSPVICWQDGDSVRCNWSIFGWGMTCLSGFIPLVEERTVDSGDFYYYQSEFITHDSGIGVRQSWYAPKDQPDSCQFLIHRLRVFSYDEQTHTNLAIGEIIDWDVPADTGIRNNSGFDLNKRLIFQQGSEYNDDDDVECMNNDDRYGGISLVQIMGEGEIPSEYFYGAFTADNTTQVYPFGGLEDDSVWKYMGTIEGISLSDSTNTDLHTVMTYRFGHTLAEGDTLDITSVLATSMGGYADFIATVQAGHQWSYDHLLPHFSCCVGMRGNIDYDPGDALDISDLVYLVDYMFTGGPEPPCFEEADVNCDGALDITDLVYLVDYMFTGGPPPAPCR